LIDRLVEGLDDAPPDEGEDDSGGTGSSRKWPEKSAASRAFIRLKGSTHVTSISESLCLDNALALRQRNIARVRSVGTASATAI
jgi:hypothetical protein